GEMVRGLAGTGRGGQYAAARWHRSLGCLVKLPAEFEDLADEDEKPPFSAFADQLGRTADQLAGWQEDLRVLYVACTRARDLLILSAGLPEPLPGAVAGLPVGVPAKAANHWTLMLAERVDPRARRCGPGAVKPEDAAAVRVSIVEPGAEEVVGSRGTQEVGDPKPTRRDGWAFSPPRKMVPPIVPLPALERLARGEPVPVLGAHFDTETDSDR